MQEPPNTSAAVNLVVPSFATDKMAAVVELSKACHELAKTLSSANLVATISGNTISSLPPGGIGISIRTEGLQ